MGEPWNMESQSPEQASISRRRNAVLRGDTIQLVESELPLTDVNNYDELAGVYLFRQLYAPCSSQVECLFCNRSYPLMHRDGLAKHYYSWHGLKVVQVRAKFGEDIVFLRAPPDVKQHETLTLPCTLCDAILNNATAFLLHYYVDHGKEVRFLPQHGMAENYSSFHCSICGLSSTTFMSHGEHLYSVHNRMTYFCKYCMFCASRPLKLCRHMIRHLQNQVGLNFQCPVCSVYLRGTDVLRRHLRKRHALQIDDAEWCCRHCYSSYEFHDDLLVHLPFCPYMKSSRTRCLQFDVTHGETCKCSDCAEEYSLQQEIKRLRDSLHSSTTDQIDVGVPNKGDGLNKEHAAEGTATKNLKGKCPGKVSPYADDMGEASSISLSEKIKAIQEKQPLESVHCSSHTDRGIHIACGGCLMYFGSEDQFAQHYCTEIAM